MDITNKISDFITEDIAYFLGLITGRGTFILSNEVTKLTIEFPFKNLKAEGISRTFDTPLYLSRSVDNVVSRLRKLGLNIEKDVSTDETQGVSLIITWHEPTDISSQFVHFLLNGDHTDYHSFRIPKAIYEADKERQKEYLRGYFDVTGHIRKSNRDQSGQHRVYLEVDHRNWMLVADFYVLIDKYLDIPIQTVDFGHPNFRGEKGWAKEHQLKIYANQFLPIGSYITHKDEVIKELASENREDVGDKRGKPRIGQKPSATDENSEKLPEYLRGKHFNHYTELLEFLISKREND